MPGLEMLGRRWKVASDDFVIPGFFKILLCVPWWLGILALFVFNMGHFDGEEGAALHKCLVGLLVVQGLNILSLCALVFVSAQGTISNPDPRRVVPALVYLRALLHLSELAFDCLGVHWVIHHSHGWGLVTVAAVIGSFIISFLTLLLTVVGVVLAFDPFGNLSRCDSSAKTLQEPKVQPAGTESVHMVSVTQTWADRVWEFRLRVAFRCLSRERQNCGGAFCSISHLLSDFFDGAFLSPSDIAAGLILLYLQQRNKDPSQDDRPRYPAPSGRNLKTELENALHWVKFASAAYKFRPHAVSGSDKHSAGGQRQAAGKTSGSNTATILRITGMRREDLLYVSTDNEVYKTPFFVALDHKREAIVVAIRGTASIQDILTDLTAESNHLSVGGISGTFQAHEGMGKAARHIHTKLMDEGILEQALLMKPDYTVHITGHSLGAGTATLLALMLREHLPTLQCYAFSPPGGLISNALAEHCKDFVVTIALGEDLVPRLSLSNMEILKDDVRLAALTCDIPKYKVFLEFISALAGDLEEDVLRSRDSLCLPGVIIHVTRDTSSQRPGGSKKNFIARWSDKGEFMEITVSPRMVNDHKLNNIIDALDRCQIQE